MQEQQNAAPGPESWSQFDIIDKDWYQSKTIVGALAGGLALILQAVGYSVDVSALTGILVSAGGLIAMAVTVWGRYTAEQPIRRGTR